MLLFCDSFDHYASADIATKWSLRAGSIAIASAKGRAGGGGLNPQENYQYVYKTLAANYSRLIVGLRVYLENTIEAGFLVYFGDGGSDQCGVKLMADGRVGFYRAGTLPYG